MIEATHRLPIVKCADCDSPKYARAVINKHWILFLSRRHARRASASCQTSLSVYISFSSDITVNSEDNFNQKQTRHFFKVHIRIKFLARYSGERKVIFQIFCSPEAKSSRHWRSGERYLNPCLTIIPRTRFGYELS